MLLMVGHCKDMTEVFFFFPRRVLKPIYQLTHQSPCYVLSKVLAYSVRQSEPELKIAFAKDLAPGLSFLGRLVSLLH